MAAAGRKGAPVMGKRDEDEERYRAIIENQALGISEVDPEENFLFANPAAHRIFGVPPGSLVGRNLSEFMDEDSFRVIRLETEKRKRGESSTYDVAIRRGDGKRRIIRVTASPRFDERGNFISALAIYSDVTELKKAEETLYQRERYYRALLHNAADMISILDGEFRFRWGSRSTALTTGYDRSIYGRTILEFIHPEDLEKARADMNKVLENPGVPLYINSRFRHADGSYHHHEAIVTNLLQDPVVGGIIINSRDITERVAMEEKLRASVRELDAFAATVAHDLRVPLSLISGYAELLRYADTTEEEREAFLDNITKAARRLEEMTASLLAYAQAGSPEGKLTKVDPATVIAEVAEERGAELDSRGIALEVEGNLPNIQADPLKLRQVFFNLLDNAIKYTSGCDNPHVRIGGRREGDMVTLFVSDNGCGVDPSMAQDIFLPFRRGTGEAGGLGIGLATVKRAVEGWGGRVWVESTPGEGASFYFTARAADAG
ncbi:MAG: PAS domain S-box protein [Actinomycetota bacterium]|nr:PAS domain S-box protein [Actinomycetota bacterium]